jgi:lipoprotein-anchoring transpeptidase ErfK/SrfK
MKTRTRDLVILVAGLAVLATVAFGGYAAVRARAEGSGASQALAPVPKVSPAPSSAAEPQYDRWTVGKAVGPLVAYAKPSTSSRVKTQLGKVNQNGYPTLVLVDQTKEVGGRVWYRVWLAVRPNGSRGWVPEGKLAFYTTPAKITIDLSERELSVQRRGELMDTYPVAVGRPGLETPTGLFFINQKLKPAAPNGAFGVLAIGISAFQMKIPASAWEQGGPVAIHGTNEPWLIGKAVSHGCVRMRNKDVLEVSRYVPAGSPVEIVR